MTNGEALTELFKDDEDITHGTNREFHHIWSKDGKLTMTIHRDWLNAEYKGTLLQTNIDKRIEYGTDGNLYEMSITNGKEYENTMREATPEELESVNNYIKSISKPTGVNIWDEIEEVTTDADGS